MPKLENDIQEVTRLALFITILNLLASLLMCFLFYASKSGLIPWAAISAAIAPDTADFLTPIAITYFGIFAFWGITITLLQSILLLKRLAECRNICKKKKIDPVSWLARLVHLPIFGLSICILGRRAGEGPHTEPNTLSLNIAMSPPGGKTDWSEVVKPRPICDFSTVDVEMYLNAKGEARAFRYDGRIYFITMTYPKFFMESIKKLDCSKYGNEVANRW